MPVEPDTRTWVDLPFALGEQWVVVLHWREVQGRQEVVGVEVWSERPADGRIVDGPISTNWPLDPRPITGKVLRMLRIPSLIENDRQRMLALLRHASENVDERYADLLGEFADRPDHPGGKRWKLDREHYEKVAAIYADADSRGRAPTKAVQKAFRVSYPTAARWVMACRREPYRLLEPTSPGRGRS